MVTVRDFLNELKWREGRSLEDAHVYYIHRGAPDDTRIVPGSRIRDLGRSFMEIEAPEGATMIPYHRVFRVEVDGRPAWERRQA